MKSKKNLAIECVKQFIKENKNHPDMQLILERLKKDMNGESSKSEYAPLLYIRQLRGEKAMGQLIKKVVRYIFCSRNLPEDIVAIFCRIS